MEKILISIPHDLAVRMRAVFPQRQRSKILATLIEMEVLSREKKLHECALAVEKDDALNQEMSAWDITLNDGLEDHGSR